MLLVEVCEGGSMDNGEAGRQWVESRQFTQFTEYLDHETFHKSHTPCLFSLLTRANHGLVGLGITGLAVGLRPIPDLVGLGMTGLVGWGVLEVPTGGLVVVGTVLL